jgi:hypothetical protein
VTGTLPIVNGGTGATTASAARTNLGLGTAATVNTGTSGATIPLLNGANTWAAAQTFSIRPTFNAATPWDSANLASPAATTGNLSQFASTTSAQLASVLSDETGTGANVFGTSPTITTPNVVGISNASNAAAGSLGQYVSSDIPIGSAVSLTTNVSSNITSVSLTAGDWMCSGTAGFLQTASTALTTISAATSTTSATLPLTEQGGYAALNLNFLGSNPYANVITVGQWRYNVSTTTTVYLVAKALFTASTESVYGFLGCLRFH